MQFHVEVTVRMAEEWGRVRAYHQAAETVLGPSGLEAVLREYSTHAGNVLATGRRLFERWLDPAAGDEHPGAAAGTST